MGCASSSTVDLTGCAVLVPANKNTVRTCSLSGVASVHAGVPAGGRRRRACRVRRGPPRRCACPVWNKRELQFLQEATASPDPSVMTFVAFGHVRRRFLQMFEPHTLWALLMVHGYR